MAAKTFDRLINQNTEPIFLKLMFDWGRDPSHTPLDQQHYRHTTHPSQCPACQPHVIHEGPPPASIVPEGQGRRRAPSPKDLVDAGIQKLHIND